MNVKENDSQEIDRKGKDSQKVDGKEKDAKEVKFIDLVNNMMKMWENVVLEFTSKESYVEQGRSYEIEGSTLFLK